MDKIDELSVKIFGRDEDLRTKLEEVEKVREECYSLQDTTQSVSMEQEQFINNLWTALGEMSKTLHDVEYSKKLDLDETIDGDEEVESLVVEKHHDNNEEDLKEELNSR